MERKRASEYPQELLDLFDLYVHGELDRRGFLERAKKFATGGVTAMALWESLRPNYAWAEQVPKDDSRLKSESVSVPSRTETAASAVTLSVPQRRPASFRACWLCMRTVV